MSKENYIIDFGKFKQIAQIKKLIKLLKKNGLTFDDHVEIRDLKQDLSKAGILGSLDSLLDKKLLIEMLEKMQTEIEPAQRVGEIEDVREKIKENEEK